MAIVEKKPGPFIRPDGKDKVTGLGRYTADMTLTGMLHARFRVLDDAHARLLRSIPPRPCAARRLRRDHAGRTCPTSATAASSRTARCLPATSSASRARSSPRSPPSPPRSRTRAAALIEVEYEPLPVVRDPELALAEGASLVHSGWEATRPTRTSCARATTARVRRSSRATPTPRWPAPTWSCEAATWPTCRTPCRSSRTRSSPSGRATGHGLVVDPGAVHRPQRGRAHARSSPSRDVRIIVPHLGGGFGGKCEFHFEAHVAALARAARRPSPGVHAPRGVPRARPSPRGQVLELETGVMNDGTLVARRGRLVLDNGAYCRRRRRSSPSSPRCMAVGPYRVPHVSIDAHLAYTNTTPSGSVRAPTAPQSCWALEQHMDAVAEAIGHRSGRAAPAQHRPRGRREARRGRSSRRSARPRRSSARSR